MSRIDASKGESGGLVDKLWVRGCVDGHGESVPCGELGNDHVSSVR